MTTIGREPGYKNLLLQLYCCDLIAFVTLPLSISLQIPGDLWLTGFALFILVVLSVEYVYKDANIINREKGYAVINANGWSYLVLFLWFAALPRYIFRERKAATTSSEAKPV